VSKKTGFIEFKLAMKRKEAEKFGLFIKVIFM